MSEPAKPSDVANASSDRGRFAARAFIARYVRETGQPPPADFAYEMGYIRGLSDGAADAMKMQDDISRSHEEARKKTDDDPNAE